MEPLGMVVIGVLVLSIVVGIYLSRQPPPWDEIGGESHVPLDQVGEISSTFDDEASLRALVAEKRARRQAAADGPTVASDRLRPGASGHAEPGSLADTPLGPPWGHVDAELIEEARALIARRRARLERTGKAVPHEHDELTRLLGPPHH